MRRRAIWIWSGMGIVAIYGVVVGTVFWHRHIVDAEWHRMLDSSISARKNMLDLSDVSLKAWETQKIDDELIEKTAKEKPFYVQITPEEQQAIDAANYDLVTKQWTKHHRW